MGSIQDDYEKAEQIVLNNSDMNKNDFVLGGMVNKYEFCVWTQVKDNLYVTSFVVDIRTEQMHIVLNQSMQYGIYCVTRSNIKYVRNLQGYYFKYKRKING